MESENLYYLWFSLNAPTGAWCSLTEDVDEFYSSENDVSMHLQVRGAP